MLEEMVFKCFMSLALQKCTSHTEMKWYVFLHDMDPLTPCWVRERSLFTWGHCLPEEIEGYTLIRNPTKTSVHWSVIHPPVMHTEI